MRIQRLLALLLMLASLPAQAFFDPPYVTPAQPQSGETVYMNIRGGECDAIAGWPGDPDRYPQITQEGNAITILWFGLRETDPLFCDLGVGTVTHALGSYPAGDYTLTVKLLYLSLLTPSGFQIDTLGVVPFMVAGGPAPSTPIGAPTLGRFGLLAIVVLLAGAAMFTLRCRFHWLLLVLLLPPALRAQDAPPMIAVLTQDASTAAAIVDYYRATPRSGSPPLESLGTGDPLHGTWLLPLRASGDFRQRLDAHPDSVRARLERMLVVAYPEGTDLAGPLAALRADPQVRSADIPPQTQPSSVELVEFGVIGSAPQGSGDYGRAALNIDAAWAIAGGHALIAVVDTGLQTSHPALRPFYGTTWTGGPFRPALSLDISLAGLTPTPQNSMDVDERRPMPISDTACHGDLVILPLLFGHSSKQHWPARTALG